MTGQTIAARVGRRLSGHLRTSGKVQGSIPDAETRGRVDRSPPSVRQGDSHHLKCPNEERGPMNDRRAWTSEQSHTSIIILASYDEIKRNEYNISRSEQTGYKSIRTVLTKTFCQTEEDVPTSNTSNDSIAFQQGANLIHSEDRQRYPERGYLRKHAIMVQHKIQVTTQYYGRNKQQMI